MAAAPSASAIRALALEYKSLAEDPVEGFRVKLLNDEDMFLWEVALFGPPDTLYQGGYFKVSQRHPGGLVSDDGVVWFGDVWCLVMCVVMVWCDSGLVVVDIVDGEDGGVVLRDAGSWTAPNQGCDLTANHQHNVRR